MSVSSNALIENVSTAVDHASEQRETELQSPQSEPLLEARSRTTEAVSSDILSVQQGVLDKIVGGASLSETLISIAQATEQVIDGSYCAVVSVNERRTEIELVAAPSLPPEFSNGLKQIRASGLARASGNGADTVKIEFEGEALRDAIRSAVVGQSLMPAQIVPVRNDSEDLLGVFVVCMTTDQPLGQGAEQAAAAMTQLVRFATEFEQRKSELQSANDRFRSLAASIPGVVYQRIVETDGSMRYSYISEAAEDLFGVPPSEIIADPQALFDCHGAEYAATFRDRLLKASKTLELWDVEATINTRDGQRKYTHAIARPTRRQDGSVQWDGVILDATRIKEAEMATAAAEARMRDTIVESMPNGFALYDSDDQLVTCNSKLRSMYPQLVSVLKAGATYAEVAQAEIERGLDVEAHVPDTESGEIPSNESRLAARLATRSASQKAVERRLSDGRWILIDEYRTADGGTVMLHTDVTELKDREAALKRSNRELQDFASIASHDLQEPLRKIEAFGDRLVARYGEKLGDDGQMYIDRMQNAAGRMRSLINDLLAYSRVTTKAKPFAPVDMSKIVADVLSDLQVAIETSDATVCVDDLPTIDAEKTQVRMLFQNLIANAIKFRVEGRPPRIEVSTTVHSKVPTEVAGDIQAKEVCEIRVKDNGIGFEMRHLDRIFGIFQRLHGRNEYEGTGVGLATCRKIAELHGGVITADSKPDQGTTFMVYLPTRQENSGEQE